MIRRRHLRLFVRPVFRLGAALAAAQARAQADMPDIRDIRGPVPLTFWEQHGTTIFISALAGLAVLALLLWLVLRRPPKPPPTPLEIARRELEAARALLVTGQDKPFAIQVSDTVRGYLERAYHLPAPERTTEEFLQQIAQNQQLRGELTLLLAKFLEWCDLAKFAGQQFGPAEREQLLDAARTFVERADELRRTPPPLPAAAHAAPPALAPSRP